MHLMGNIRKSFPHNIITMNRILSLHNRTFSHELKLLALGADGALQPPASPLKEAHNGGLLGGRWKNCFNSA